MLDGGEFYFVKYISNLNWPNKSVTFMSLDVLVNKGQ